MAEEIGTLRLLVVVDMQNDFITGELSTDYAKTIIPKIVEKIRSYKCETIDDEYHIMLTKDTHGENYLDTLEGKNINAHCIFYTDGNEFIPEIKEVLRDELEPYNYIEVVKNTFGCTSIVDSLLYAFEELGEPFDLTGDNLQIEIVGVCTDICVVTNALLLRTFFPNVPIKVDSSCCAGTSKANHDSAITVMKNCLIDVV